MDCIWASNRQNLNLTSHKVFFDKYSEGWESWGHTWRKILTTSTKIFKFQVEKEVKFKGLKDWLQWWIQQLAGPGGAQELSEAEKKGGEL